MLRFCDEQASFLGQIVSKNEVNLWEVGGKWLKPINFDVEIVLGLR